MLETRLEELEKGLRKLLSVPAIQDVIKAHEESLKTAPTEPAEATDGKDG